MDPHTEPDPSHAALTFSLSGDVDHSDFGPWMERQALKLGVGFAMVQRSPDELVVRANGAPEMTQAFALACSLGPKSVQIDQLRVLDGGKSFQTG